MNIETFLKIIWSIALAILIAWLGKEGYRSAIEYEHTSAKIAQMMEAKKVAEYKIKDLANLLTLGAVKNDLRDRLRELQTKQAKAEAKSKKIILYFAMTVVVVAISSWLLPIRLATALLSITALISLLNGLITPILMIIVHKNIEYLGDVILSFESKSILGSIEKLYNGGNIPIAITILIFSILIPTLKTFSLLFVSIYERRPFATKMVHFFKYLGKWSMLDVFVVALLLVFLTSQGTDTSRAKAEIGIYFFLAYVILSMGASIVAEKMLKEVRN